MRQTFLEELWRENKASVVANADDNWFSSAGISQGNIATSAQSRSVAAKRSADRILCYCTGRWNPATQVAWSLACCWNFGDGLSCHEHPSVRQRQIAKEDKRKEYPARRNVKACDVLRETMIAQDNE